MGHLQENGTAFQAHAQPCRAWWSEQSLLPEAAGHLPYPLPTAPHSPLQKDPKYYGQQILGSTGETATSSVWVTTRYTTLELLTTGYEVKL